MDEEALKSAGEVNHFHPDYRKPGEAWAVPNMEGQRYSFQSARDRFQAAGRKVINASRVTKLDVFPPVTSTQSSVVEFRPRRFNSAPPIRREFWSLEEVDSLDVT